MTRSGGERGLPVDEDDVESVLQRLEGLEEEDVDIGELGAGDAKRAFEQIKRELRDKIRQSAE